MVIRFEKGIEKDNALLLCEWSNARGRAFQEQWMGPSVPYPLSYDKIRQLENLFSIFCGQDFIGVIQQVRSDRDSVHIGRFILDPQKTGLGLGAQALKSFADLIFEDDRIISITLTVFDRNQRAKRLYEKLGFEIDEVIEAPKLKYILRLCRPVSPCPLSHPEA